MSVRPADTTNDTEPASVPYDEMLTPAAAVRPHYAALEARLSTLSPDELAERQKTQERFFLLQGITFTVYGAESSTERIIPTDILPRIIPGAEWARIEAGLIQRLRALNMFLADIYSDQKILMDGVVPRELVLQAPSYRREMQNLYVPHKAYANVCGSDLIRQTNGEFAVTRTIYGSRPASPICWPIAKRHGGCFPELSAARACARSTVIRTCF